MYHATRRRVTALVVDLDPNQLATPVPGTPAWTVQDLLAHLSGVAADLVAGNMEGAATDAWTARQVAQRRGRASSELLEEWEGNAPAVEAFLAGVDFHPFVVDVFTHEHDLRGALGEPGSSDAAVTPSWWAGSPPWPLVRALARPVCPPFVSWATTTAGSRETPRLRPR